MGGRFYLAKDDREHTISVTADGFEPWTHSFIASRDLRVDVSMKASAPAVAPTPPKPVAATKPPRQPVVQPQVPVRPQQPKPEGGRPKRVITELDY